MIKRTCVFLFAILLIAAFFPATSYAASEISIDAKSYILMDVQTGTALSEKDADKSLPCANVVKNHVVAVIHGGAG